MSGGVVHDGRIDVSGVHELAQLAAHPSLPSDQREGLY